MNRTLAIVKPSALKKNVLGKIVSVFEENELRVVEAEIRTLAKTEVEQLYAQHSAAFFFPKLLEYMSSAPVFICVLEGEDAVLCLRKLIGPTDPAQAGEKTLRGQFGDDILHNGLHGSLSEERAVEQIALLFK